MEVRVLMISNSSSRRVVVQLRSFTIPPTQTSVHKHLCTGKHPNLATIKEAQNLRSLEINRVFKCIMAHYNHHS